MLKQHILTPYSLVENMNMQIIDSQLFFSQYFFLAIDLYNQNSFFFSDFSPLLKKS